jgi:Xaa-Pro aminopeptidase
VGITAQEVGELVADAINSRSQGASVAGSFKRPVIANIDRLNETLDREGLSAVVARSGQDFTYLSGVMYPGTLGRHLDITDSPRGVLILWPRRGEPIIILNKIAEGFTRRDSWVQRLEVYDAYAESPYQRLAKIIKDAGLDRERIGIEKNYVSAAHWEELQQLLPRVQLVDCAAMMDRVRWVKTPHEIALLKKGADLLDDAYLEVFPTIRPGTTEREVHARLIYSCLQRGAGWAHGILNSSTNIIAYGGEGDTVFQRGDVVRTDYVAYLVEGYPGHQSRNAVLGTPSAEQKREYSTVRDIYRMTIDRCRPGARAGDVFEFVVEEYRKQGWNLFGLVGHGVGPWWHQQEPIIARGSETILEEGMVLALEPHKAHWHIQDMVVVRKGGPELLSSKFPTDEPFVTG